jgi:hypothetical protein
MLLGIARMHAREASNLFDTYEMDLTESELNSIREPLRQVEEATTEAIKHFEEVEQGRETEWLEQLWNS